MLRGFKSVLMLVMLFMAIVITAGDTYAQSTSKGSDNSALELQYQSQKKNEVLAGVGEVVIPLIGNAYAGDVKRGIVPAAMRVGGLVMMIGSSVDDYQGENSGMVLLGAAISTVGGIWGGVRAYNTAKNYNSALRKEMGLPSISMIPSIEPGFTDGRYNVSLLSFKY